MRILVTGASGFIGSHVVRRLTELGHDVIATGRNSAGLAGVNDVQCIIKRADLAVDDLAPLLEDVEAVVHCAARAAPWGKRELFWSDNVVATQRLLTAARRAGSVVRFVHLSSPSIYFRNRDQLNISESFDPPKRWYTAYAETKWIAEEHVRAASELSPIILRPRAVYGPRDTTIVPRIVSVARSGLFPLPHGGEAWTDVTYVEGGIALQGSLYRRDCIVPWLHG